MSAWYIQLDGTPIGPVSSEELKRLAAAGRIRPDMLVRKGDQGKWYPAQRVAGLLPTVPAEEKPKEVEEPARSLASTADRTSVNLIPCPDCNRLVSKRAIFCPSCGCPFAEPDRESKSGHQIRAGNASSPAPSGGIDFVTVHDVDDDGVADVFVMHNTEKIGKAVADFREAVGIPDDETQWRSLKKWGWLFSLAAFSVGFFVAYDLFPEGEGKTFYSLMAGGIIGGVPLLMTFAAHWVASD